jgi:hypothetical protein
MRREQPPPHEIDRSVQGVGVPTQLAGGAHSARVPLTTHRSGLVQVYVRTRLQASRTV